MKFVKIEKSTPLVEYLRGLPLSFDQGVVVAGGAARNVFEGIPPQGDVDIFVPNETIASQMDETIMLRNTVVNRETRESKNKIRSYNYDVKFCSRIGKIDLKVQVVNMFHFKTPKEILESFDFTICQFATDGYKMLYTDRAVEDLANRVFHVTQSGSPRSWIAQRLLKYADYGFDPGPGVLEWALNLDKLDIGSDYRIIGGTDCGY